MTIQNSVAYKTAICCWRPSRSEAAAEVCCCPIRRNGNLHFDPAALTVEAGNGNGFKMGGTNLPGGHKLLNSISYDNAAKGIDSNSCPDIQVYNSTSYNNGG